MPSFARAYAAAVRAAYETHLAPLGFEFKHERNGAMLAQSRACEVLFHHGSFVPFLRRTSAEGATAQPAYELPLLLEALGQDPDLRIPPITGPDVMNPEVDRLVGLLAEHCRSLMDGDEEAWQRVRECSSRKEDQFFGKLRDAGLHLKDEEGWRELPELESVKAEGSSKAAVIGLLVILLLPMMGLIICAVWGLVVYLINGGKKPLSYYVSADPYTLVLVALVWWVASRYANRQFFWQTGADGLTIGGLWKNRTIPWDDVISVDIIPGSGYRFQTAAGAISLDKLSLAQPMLEASIWQHLNRVGKASTLALSPMAASFWAEFPEEKFAQLYWENPQPRHGFDVVLRAAGWEVLLVLLMTRGWSPALWLLLPVTVLPAFWALYSLIIISHITVDSSGIRASTGVGRIDVPWSAVRGVKFVDRGITQPGSLQLRIGLFRHIRIPWYPEHPNSTRIMLAIMRRLRQEERFKMLPFPAVLLLAAHGPAEGEGVL